MSFKEELVVPMPGMRVAQLEQLGLALRQTLELGSAAVPAPIRWLPIIDHVLPHYGIHVSPASEDELQGDEGATDPTGGPETNILLRADVYDSLDDMSPRGNRARATMPHELGHAILHVPVIRRRQALPNGSMLLRRVSRGSIEPFRDPEWQAWTLALSLVAPRAAILAVGTTHVPTLAEAFGISEVFMRQHLRRLKLIGAASRDWRWPM